MAIDLRNPWPPDGVLRSGMTQAAALLLKRFRAAHERREAGSRIYHSLMSTTGDQECARELAEAGLVLRVSGDLWELTAAGCEPECS